MQNFASGTQISPHFEVDVTLKEHFDWTFDDVTLKEHFDWTFPDEDPDADPADAGPENIILLN